MPVTSILVALQAILDALKAYTVLQTQAPIDRASHNTWVNEHVT